MPGEGSASTPVEFLHRRAEVLTQRAADLKKSPTLAGIEHGLASEHGAARLGAFDALVASCADELPLELVHAPYIRNEEILDSIKTHVLKKVAGIGRFRRFTWRVRCERHRRSCRSS